MDEGLRALAAGRGGTFTSGMAGVLGIGSDELAVLRRRGEAVRVRRDAYVLGDLWNAATPVGRFRLRTLAILDTRPGDVASHQAALAVHRLPLYGVPLNVVDVMGSVTRVRKHGMLRIHARSKRLMAVLVDDRACVPLSTAIVQVARRHGLTAAMVPLDAALHENRTTHSHVARAVDELMVKGHLRARGEVLLERSDPRCESPGETRTRLLLRSLGLSARSQIEVRDRSGRFLGRVDFLLDQRIIVEFDGAVKYAGADGRAALVAEKAREDALRAEGFGVVRLTWRDLDNPLLVQRKIRTARTGLLPHGAATAVS